MRQSNQNIEYKSQAIVGYFAENRCSLSDFYPSERKVFEYLAHMRGNSLGNVLDVGCATGGLGRALSERYDVKKYTGVEIHKGAADYASKADYPFPSHILHGDIMSLPELSGKFDSVFALSCADWNVDTWGIILACWNRVSPGGTLLISQRITAKKSIIDAELSYQYIYYEDGEPTGNEERANYAVLNIHDALGGFSALENVGEIYGYGYWGAPSRTARTPFKKLVFGVFAISKASSTDSNDPLPSVLKIEMPTDLFYPVEK